MKNIQISKKTWQHLRKLRDQQGFVHFNSTVEFLLDYFEKDTLPEEKPVVSEQKPKASREEIKNAIDEVLRRRLDK